MIPYTGEPMHDCSSGSTNSPEDSEQGDICGACLDPYLVRFYLPEEIWDQVAGGLRRLCLSCADARARKLGIELYWEAKVGEFPGAFMRRVQKIIAENRPVLDRLAET